MNAIYGRQKKSQTKKELTEKRIHYILYFKQSESRSIFSNFKNTTSEKITPIL